ncbi:hypothetical protein H9M94_01425 [Mycoplasma sp. Pen4]|uniref:lipoprotein 17-related variable surface protein n=1 Tax=Mycoplasma sp. Pen4 TaxID=640330 RepID=UPI0016548FC8|nr:lipoprotein 17-related variable surface protein [Mycoplasma sp. Pen4]QNM93916.1 hypothetical protein H9M94_01425 [Mycoplasma sp. Pen4]
MKKNNKKLLFLPAFSVVALAAVSGTRSSADTQGTNSGNPNLWKRNDKITIINPSEINSDYYSAAKWMRDLPDNRSIFSLSIPATHDTGTQSVGGAPGNYARTQAFSYYNQLKLGIRAYDIRVDSDMIIRHGPTYGDGDLDKVLAETSKFLKENPSEFVIMRIKDETENWNLSDANQIKKANKKYFSILDKYRDSIYNPDGRSRWAFNNFTVGEFRGKIIILNKMNSRINNSRKGGFLYYDFITSGATEQDQFNSINSTSHKAELVKEMIQKTNASPYNSQAFYVNFLSWSNSYDLFQSWKSKPYLNSPEVNAKIHKYLQDNPQFTKLGIVYMDFPGPTLIQNIYKRNYYYSEPYLQSGGLGPLTQNLRIEPISTGDKGITLITNGQNQLKNLYVKVFSNNVLIKTLTIPSNYSNNTYTIPLYTGSKEISDNEVFRIETHKTTPSNQFYVSRNYDEHNFNDVRVTYRGIYFKKQQFLIKLNALLGLVSQTNFIQNYVTDLINKTNAIADTDPEGNAKLTALIDKYNDSSNKLVKLSAEYQAFLEKAQEPSFDSDNELYSLFKTNTALVDKVKSLKTNTITNATNAFTTITYDNLSSIKLDELITDTIKVKLVLGALPSLFSTLKSYDINPAYNQIIQLAADGAIAAMPNVNDDNAKRYWRKRIVDNVEFPSNIINKIFNATDLDDLETTTQQSITTYTAETEELKDQLPRLLEILENIKDINVITATVFSKEIAYYVVNLENTDALFETIQTYNGLISKVKNEILNRRKPISRAYHRFRRSSNQQGYLWTEVEKLHDELEKFSKSTEPVEDGYIDSIERAVDDFDRALNDIVPNITDWTLQIENVLNNATHLYDKQKENVKDILKHPLLLSADKVTELVNNIQIADAYEPKAKVELLTELNQQQKALLIEQIDTTINVEEMSQIINDFKETNSAMQELKQTFEVFANYSSNPAFLVQTQEMQANIMSAYENANNVLTNLGASTEQVNAAKVTLDQYVDLFVVSKNKLNNLVASSDKLYTFEKNELFAEIANASTEEERNALDTKILDAITTSIKTSDANLYSDFTETQRINVSTQLESSTTRDAYSALKTKFDSLKTAIANAKTVLNQYNNLITRDFYVNNSTEEQTKIDNALTAFTNVINTSVDPDTIAKANLAFNDAIEKAKQSSSEYQLESARQRIISAYNNQKQTLTAAKAKYMRKSGTTLIYSELISQIDSKILTNDAVISDDNSTNEQLQVALDDITSFVNNLDNLAQPYDEKSRLHEINVHNFEEDAEKFVYFLPITFGFTHSPSMVQKSDLLEGIKDHINLITNTISVGTDLRPITDKEITNLTFTPNDETGTLTISYTYNKAGLSKNKNQVIEGLATANQLAILNANLELSSTVNKAKELLLTLQNNNDYLELATELQSKINEANSISASSSLDDITGINEKLKALITSTNIAKSTIDLEATKAKNNTIQKITDYLNEISTISYPNILSDIELLQTQFTAYKNSLNNDQLTREEIATISSDVDTKIADLNAKIQTEKDKVELNKIIDGISLTVTNKSVLPSEVRLSFLTFNNLSNNATLSQVDIVPHDSEMYIEVSYTISYKNLSRRLTQRIDGFISLTIDKKNNKIKTLKTDYEAKVAKVNELITQYLGGETYKSASLANQQVLVDLALEKSAINEEEKDEAISTLTSINLNLDTLIELIPYQRQEIDAAVAELENMAIMADIENKARFANTTTKNDVVISPKNENYTYTINSYHANNQTGTVTFNLVITAPIYNKQRTIVKTITGFNIPDSALKTALLNDVDTLKNDVLNTILKYQSHSFLEAEKSKLNSLSSKIEVLINDEITPFHDDSLLPASREKLNTYTSELQAIKQEIAQAIEENNSKVALQDQINLLKTEINQKITIANTWNYPGIFTDIQTYKNTLSEKLSELNNVTTEEQYSNIRTLVGMQNTIIEIKIQQYTELVQAKTPLLEKVKPLERHVAAVIAKYQDNNLISAQLGLIKGLRDEITNLKLAITNASQITDLGNKDEKIRLLSERLELIDNEAQQIILNDQNTKALDAYAADANVDVANKVQMPSHVLENQLNITNIPSTVVYSNVTLEPNDIDLSLVVRFTLTYQGVSKEYSKTITDFINPTDNAKLTQINQLNREYNAKQKELTSYIRENLNEDHYSMLRVSLPFNLSQITKKVDAAKASSNNDATISAYQKAIADITTLITQAKTKKQEIDTNVQNFSDYANNINVELIDTLNKKASTLTDQDFQITPPSDKYNVAITNKAADDANGNITLTLTVTDPNADSLRREVEKTFTLNTNSQIKQEMNAKINQFENEVNEVHDQIPNQEGFLVQVHNIDALYKEISALKTKVSNANDDTEIQGYNSGLDSLKSKLQTIVNNIRVIKERLATESKEKEMQDLKDNYNNQLEELSQTLRENLLEWKETKSINDHIWSMKKIISNLNEDNLDQTTHLDQEIQKIKDEIHFVQDKDDLKKQIDSSIKEGLNDADQYDENNTNITSYIHDIKNLYNNEYQSLYAKLKAAKNPDEISQLRASLSLLDKEIQEKRNLINDHKDDSSSGLGYLSLLLLIPVIGAAIYFFILKRRKSAK